MTVIIENKLVKTLKMVKGLYFWTYKIDIEKIFISLKDQKQFCAWLINKNKYMNLPILTHSTQSIMPATLTMISCSIPWSKVKFFSVFIQPTLIKIDTPEF